MPVTNMTSLGGLNKLKAVHNLKQREVYCPVTKSTVQTTPLTTGDDLSLRTMISSPDLYDKEIALLIYKHCKFPDFETHPTFENFVDNFSSFDRRILLYGIFASTYDKISEEKVECPNCGFTFTDTIKSEEIVRPDMYSVWDKDEPFTNYHKQVKIDINPDTENTINNLVFFTRIPSIRDHFNILKMVSPTKMKNNFEKTGSILSKPEELTLITQVIQVNSTVNGNPEVDNINDMESVHKAISEYITSDTVRHVISEYNDEFEKYSPDFQKPYLCSECGHEYDLPINIELSLFRSFFG